jgi:hypothetical protein
MQTKVVTVQNKPGKRDTAVRLYRDLLFRLRRKKN